MPLSERDFIIFSEMLSHPALFTHHKPRKIAVIGDEASIPHEILKHQSVTAAWCFTPTPGKIEDQRINFVTDQPSDWLKENNQIQFDILIKTNTASETDLGMIFQSLQPQGIFMHASGSPFQIDQLKKVNDVLKATGFKDIQLLQFPQPSFATGWRVVWMAKKEGVLSQVKEGNIFNRTFTTEYYNFDMHQAALALPEFLRKELT